MAEKHWIKGAIKHPGALRRALHVKPGEAIPEPKIAKAAKATGKLGQRARLAETLKGMSHGGHADDRKENPMRKMHERKPEEHKGHREKMERKGEHKPEAKAEHKKAEPKKRAMKKMEPKREGKKMEHAGGGHKVVHVHHHHHTAKG